MLYITLIALMLAICFGVGWFVSNRSSALVAALLWLCAPIYNALILNCSDDCGTRLDLFFSIPLLLVISLTALIQILHTCFSGAPPHSSQQTTLSLNTRTRK